MKTTIASTIKPDREIWLDDFAENEYVLPGNKRYSFDRTPYTRAVLRALTPLDTDTREVVLIGATQFGKSEISNIAMIGLGMYYSGPGIFAFPTEPMAEDHVTEKINPTLISMRDKLRHKLVFDESKKKKKGKRLAINFLGGTFDLSAIQSVTSIRNKSKRYVFMTDIDSDQFVTRGEGDSISVVKKRADSYPFNAKIFMESTPRLKGISRIEREYGFTSRGRWLVPCPHCGSGEWWDFGGKDADFGFKFSRHKDDSIKGAWILCSNCLKPIEEKDKARVNNAGEYVHEFPHRTDKGFWANGFHGFVPWKSIAKEWVQAQGNYEAIQVFFNTRRARSYELPGTKRLNWQKLKAIAEDYPILQMPDKPCVLSLGVDTHDKNLHYMLVAFGKNMEAWILFAGEFIGDPNNPMDAEPWKSLIKFCNRDFVDRNGMPHRIMSIAQDMAGHRDEACKRFYRYFDDDRYILVRGARTATGPILSAPQKVDYEDDGIKVKDGAQYWPVNDHAAKIEIFNGFREDAANRIHISKRFGDELFKQLTAEELKATINKDGYPVMKWTNTRPGRDNHWLDCLKYAYAGIMRFMPTINFDVVQNVSRETIRPKPAKVQPVRHRRRGLNW